MCQGRRRSLVQSRETRRERALNLLLLSEYLKDGPMHACGPPTPAFSMASSSRFPKIFRILPGFKQSFYFLFFFYLNTFFWSYFTFFFSIKLRVYIFLFIKKIFLRGVYMIQLFKRNILEYRNAKVLNKFYKNFQIQSNPLIYVVHSKLLNKYIKKIIPKYIKKNGLE